MTKTEVSLKEFIQSEINGLRSDIKDVKGDVASLRNDFVTMEKGRLTALEREVIQFKATIKTWGTVAGLVLLAVQLYLTFRK